MISDPNRTLATSFVPASATPAAACTPTGAVSTARTGVPTVARVRAEMPIAIAAWEKSVLHPVGTAYSVGIVLGSDQNPFGTPVDAAVRRDVTTGVHARGRPVCT